eukprot:TRINITY_DN88690_c0_g1_i1.p1 TRINITY_DN88690_c0_g1~~TRINITY_DN88690_c0_g1_i1.p1  ORF type:complete len:238 (-),score=45.16 TRINITY_DN88690_c0_g1_i1:42-686(-)
MALARNADSRRSRKRSCLCFVLGVSTLWTLSATQAFVTPGVQSRLTSVPLRAAGGFDDTGSSKTEPKVKAALSQEQLEMDHGDKWQMVDDILKGKRAASPEAMMRARFTALRFKDPQFLASTEKDDSLSIKKRAEAWSVTLGLEERSWWDKLFAGDIQSLENPDSFEVISSGEDFVEFKIRCKDGKTLTEKSPFIKDRKWGYVFSGDSEFAEWS